MLVRQRPGTAKGVIFATLEDETGTTNCIVWPDVFERYRRIVLGAQLLAVTGRMQREGMVIHVIAETLADLSRHLRLLREPGAPTATAPLDAVLARADAVKHPNGDPRTALPKGRNFR